MKSILEACEPRPEILAGTFNPEMFKASLSRVLEDYGKGEAVEGATAIYSDPVAFFRDATHVTQGIREVVGNVLARLVGGDLSTPALQRLDTAFGGGKTHTLIALAHAALRGNAIAPHLEGIVDASHLPDPESLRLVGIIGDTVDPIREPAGEGQRALPNSLWWLIAQQTLSDAEQAPIAARLAEAAAPGSDEFFDTLFGSRPTVLVIDEIAQYLARMEAAFPGTGAQQAAGFLMSLATYAEDRSHLSVVVSLASASNAFGDYNQLVGSLMDTHGITESEAADLVSRGQRSVVDVVNRSAEATTPVQQGDLSRIMAKRLFQSVESRTAREVSAAFVELYRRAGTELPSAAKDPRIEEHLAEHYPFHPSLIEFLSQELAQVEAFQGTRGVLRTLARAVRRLWEAGTDIPLIQLCHLDLSEAPIRSELLGKTGNSELDSVLDADVSKPRGSPAVGRTVANELDAANPHPEGLPVHEWAWRTVFMHSLVGRAGGLADERFGVDMVTAVYETAAPAIPPATVRSALEQVSREAHYLREREGRLYADTAPTLNNIVRRIEQQVTEEQALERVEEVVRRLVQSDVFEVHPGITSSEAIPDKVNRPQLGILSFAVEEFDPQAWVENCGDGPRLCQNLVFLLAHQSAHPRGEAWGERRVQDARRSRQRILATARKTLALEKLGSQPDNWGVSREQLQQSEFRERRQKAPNELRTAVEESFRFLGYPGRDAGRVVIRDIGKSGGGPAAGGQGGLLLETAITNHLTTEGELITATQATTLEVLQGLNPLFFASNQQIGADRVAEGFARNRPWPILESPRLLADILREGVNKGAWCLGHMPEPSAQKPEAFYDRESRPPITVEPQGAEWFICTREHAKTLGWLESIARDPDLIANWVKGTVEELVEGDIGVIEKQIESNHDRMDQHVFREQVENLVKSGELVAWPEDAFGEDGKPDPEQAMHRETVPTTGLPQTEVRLLPVHVARERGWLVQPQAPERDYKVSDPGKIKQVLNMLGGVALRDSKTEVRSLRISGNSRAGGSVQLSFLNTTVGELVESRAVFADFATRLRFDSERAMLLVQVGDASRECRFVAALDGMKDQ